jgi:hypothetical protein
MDGKPKFDQPETEAVAHKMYEVTELQKQGKFKPKRDKDVLSRTIGSEEHGGYVRGVFFKLTIKDGFQQDRVSYRRHGRYKEEMKEAVEKALESKFREFSGQQLQRSSSPRYYGLTYCKSWGNNRW